VPAVHGRWLERLDRHGGPSKRSQPLRPGLAGLPRAARRPTARADRYAVANGTALDLSDVAGVLPADADIHPTFCTYWAHFPFPYSPLGSAATGEGVGQVSSGGFNAVTGQAHSTAPLPIGTITNVLDPVYVELAFTASGGGTTEAYHVWVTTVLDFARSGGQFALAQYWTDISSVALDEVVGSAPSSPSWIVAEPHGGVAVMKPPHMIAARPVG